MENIIFIEPGVTKLKLLMNNDTRTKKKKKKTTNCQERELGFISRCEQTVHLVRHMTSSNIRNGFSA